MAVDSRKKLIEYCLRELGEPLLKINVAEEQVLDRVDEALEYFYEYHWDGIEKVYLKHQFTQADIDTQQIQLNDSLIYGVSNIIYMGNSSSSDALLNLEYQLRLNDVYNLIGTDLISYSLARQQLALLNHLLVGEKQFRYNRILNTIHLDFNVDSNYQVGNYILVECYRVLDPTQATALWSNQFLKHYTTALIKKQWGSNLKKFSGMLLPGGISINGNELYDEAIKEIEELKDELMNKSAPLNFFSG